jgi:hypothetical protein
MKLNILAIVAVVAMSFINPANAIYFTAIKLLSECETESTINRAICNGYLAGTNDSHEMHTGLDEGAKKLLSGCETKSTINRVICNGYLAGASDAHELHTGLDEGAKKSICIPTGASIERLRKVFVRFANDNPKDSKLDAASVTINAFAEAFPCE